MSITGIREKWEESRSFRAASWLAALVLLYCVYVFGIWQNPPGFYVDESALSYNGYLVAQTGAGEFGPKFPLFFQVYTHGFQQYSNPTHIYLLAGLFTIAPPSILAARLFAAFWVFAACILLGLFARRISGRTRIGAAVGGMALLTPWLFEISRLVLETFFYPMAVVLLLWSVYRVSEKEKWGWVDVTAIVGSLVLITYSYTIGRLLGPMLAGGLILFAVSRSRIVSVLKVWMLFAVTMVPLFVYLRQNPELTTRFKLISYIKPGVERSDIVLTFIRRFLQDINPIELLFYGDPNPRHHLPDVWGSFYVAVYVLAILGIVIIIRRYRWNSWWLYVLFGTVASVIPGSLTLDKFHTLRMLAHPVFLLILTVPALEFLLERTGRSQLHDERSEIGPKMSYWHTLRGTALTGLIIFGAVEILYFHTNHYLYGADRTQAFDAEYKQIYDEAVKNQPRPLYLVDGYWGPMYMHAYWYATIEGRGTSEFVHVPFPQRPPSGAVVLSSEQACSNCIMISQEGNFLLYEER